MQGAQPAHSAGTLWQRIRSLCRGADEKARAACDVRQAANRSARKPPVLEQARSLEAACARRRLPVESSRTRAVSVVPEPYGIVLAQARAVVIQGIWRRTGTCRSQTSLLAVELCVP